MHIDFVHIVISILAFAPAIILHEVAHGLAAYALGDPTAHDRGRLSLNPLKHMDPFGSVILPAILILFGGPVFGYAKPVPYNPHYFKNPRRDDALVGLAGPCANLIQASVAALLFVMGGSILSQLAANSALFELFLTQFLPTYLFVNLYLMLFNLLPIPPLDGSSIFALLLPKSSLPTYYRIQSQAMPLLLVLLFILPSVLNFDPIGMYLQASASFVAGILFDLSAGAGNLVHALLGF